MRISRAIIKNYRNLKDVDVRLENLVTLIGENNSGKSNFLRALTLPLLTDENGLSKQLSWHDINNSCKNDFYQYLNKNREAIVNGSLELANFIPNIPEVAETCLRDIWLYSRQYSNQYNPFILLSRIHPAVLLSSLRKALSRNISNRVAAAR